LGDGCQGVLLVLAHAVFGEQLPELFRPDAALPGLDPADLRPVAFQHAGRVFQDEPLVLAVPAQRGAEQEAPCGWCFYHG
jgi:hypothetical protein